MRIMNCNKTMTTEPPINPSRFTNCNAVVSKKCIVAKQRKKDHCYFNTKIEINREMINHANGDIVCITHYKWCDETRRVRTRKVVDVFNVYKE